MPSNRSIPGILGVAWVSDITYIKTRQGWFYLTTVIDLGDRKIIGWALSVTMKAIDTVIPAFKMAQVTRAITQELIFHSDRGVQYACNEFRCYILLMEKLIALISIPICLDCMYFR